jgi:hypothetical protein
MLHWCQECLIYTDRELVQRPWLKAPNTPCMLTCFPQEVGSGVIGHQRQPHALSPRPRGSHLPLRTAEVHRLAILKQIPSSNSHLKVFLGRHHLNHAFEKSF